MDYREQQAYLRSSRIRGAFSALLFLALSVVCVWRDEGWDMRARIPLLLVSLALACSIYYSPDYLHMTVVPDKRERWQIKIRWRIIAALLILGLSFGETSSARILVLIAAVWLVLCNVVIKKLAPFPYRNACFWVADLALIALMSQFSGILFAVLFLAISNHLAIVTAEKIRPPAVVFIAIQVILVFFLGAGSYRGESYGLWYASLVVAAPLLTAWLVRAAEKQNAKNLAAAMAELVDFTGYAPQRILRLWETSNQQLAKNWECAAIPQDDRERMAEWYRQNSELYLFAISAYNLEYKRIKSNLKVIRFARGSCLDYGAGNGEILLELARRGHPVTYFDVEGVTMKFAQKRAQQHGLAMEIVRSKDELKAAAQKRGFDTIFSFDVLEHLPDLPGELTFLSSLLAPNGILVFDVPAGSTQAHPMHLNHSLNVLDFLSAKGLKDRRSFSLRMPFRKEEKYVFEA